MRLFCLFHAGACASLNGLPMIHPQLQFYYLAAKMGKLTHVGFVFSSLFVCVCNVYVYVCIGHKDALHLR